MFKNNPEFELAHTSGNNRYYILKDHTQYHTSRLLAAQNQLIFSSSGATKDVLTAHLDKIIEYCNEPKPIATLRTDIAAVCHALKARTRYPVDEKCAIRLGAILCFSETEHQSEDINTTTDYWLNFKMREAYKHADLYTFFFELGNKQYSRIQGTIKYFQSTGLLSDEGGSDTGGITSKLATISELINNNINSYQDSCILRAQGDQEKADYLFNCSFTEYYGRIQLWNRYQQQQKEAHERQAGKTTT